uniref:Uncharacterized protein n=1 Tax=Sciurus vulgaris TaxID=55149 RepID=A0A8D2JIH3_SCIVU
MVVTGPRNLSCFLRSKGSRLQAALEEETLPWLKTALHDQLNCLKVEELAFRSGVSSRREGHAVFSAWIRTVPCWCIKNRTRQSQCSVNTLLLLLGSTF